MEPNPYTELVIEAAKAVIAVALAFLVPAAGALAVRLFKKAGLEVNAEVEALVRQRIRDVAIRIEEGAAKAIKSGRHAPLAGDKLSLLARDAEAFLVAVAPAYLRKPFERQLVKWIHEEIPKVGIGAIASLKQKAIDAAGGQ